MTGKNGDIYSVTSRKGKSSAWKAIGNTLLIIVMAAISFKGFLLYQDSNETIRQLQNRMYQFNEQNSSDNNQYQRLLQAYNSLQQENATLKNNYETLKKHLDSTQLKSTQLSSDYNRLRRNYQGLDNQFSTYQNSSLPAPYVAISDRNIHVAFRKLDMSLVQWVIPFGSLETEMKRADQTRTGLLGMGMPTVLLKEKSGKELLVADFRAFMDSGTFKTVMADLYDQSPDEATFIKEAWNLVGQMVQYQSEQDEIPRFPLETLIGGAGDCEDMAILFASLIEAAPVQWDVRFVYLNSKSPLDTKGLSDHVIVFIDTGKATHYIETTSMTNMEPYSRGVAGWYLPVE